eukprot:m.93913 g.93913  ORF g.93913 m.93913 type:complete len:422 (-) comp13416_c0_seq2:98-1363(-)
MNTTSTTTTTATRFLMMYMQKFLLVMVLLCCQYATSDHEQHRIKSLWFGALEGRYLNSSERELVTNHSFVIVGGGMLNASYNPDRLKQEAVMHTQIVRLRETAKARQKTPLFMVYRNGLEALPGYKVADGAMQNESLDFLWLRNRSAAGAPICNKYQPTFHGYSRFYDFRNLAVVDWFLQNVVAPVAHDDEIDGVFWDEADWATCGFGDPIEGMKGKCDGAWSLDDVAAMWHGQVRLWQGAFVILTQSKKRMILSLLSARQKNGGAIDNFKCFANEDTFFEALSVPLHDIIRPYLDILWFGAQSSPQQCSAYIENMIEDAASNATIITRGLVPKEGGILTAESALAAVLMSDNGKVYNGLSSGWGVSDFHWWPFYDKYLGAPLSPAVNNMHVWHRNFSNAVAMFDCNAKPYVGKVVFKPLL